eukprot:Lithocolla_globosa_v1_NODE_324_length_4471_cov_1015.959466.p2 type:complete len:349 gc:universal NODE_324_length_4471_cov_1015.959466:1230-184(-)
MELLKRIYYDPKLGLKSARDLYKQVDGLYGFEQVKEFVDKQEVDQLHRKKVVRDYIPIGGGVGTYQCDLTFFEQYKTSNKGYYIILTGINVNTRKAFCKAMKNKKEETVIDYFEEIIEESKDMKVVGFDNGSEFKTAFRKMLGDNGISYYVADTADKTKMSMIERFNRTLRGKIEKYSTAYKTNTWYDVLDKLVEGYNNSVHSSIGMKPNDVGEKEENKIILDKAQKTFSIINGDGFVVGDKVRLKRNKGVLEKKTGENFYKGIYTVSQVLGTSYRITNENGDELNRSIKGWELMKIDGVESLDVEVFDREGEVKAHKINKKLKEEGIDLELIIPEKRERKKPDRLKF